MKGRVLQSTGSWYLVKLENGQLMKCRIKGKFRIDDQDATNPVAVGDIVEVEQEENAETGVINDIHQRENYLVRESPRKRFTRHILAANLDQAFIITTIKNPNFKQGFTDRFLVICEAYHVKPIIIINKVDLLREKDLPKLAQVMALYESIGYKVIQTSAVEGTNLQQVKDLMKDKVSLLSGHSGVGKSTFANAIFPELNLKTSTISNYSGKGVHTTTFATMYELPFGGFLIDTPGIKELSIMDLEPEELAHYFPEMRNRMNDCQFSNCLHINEPGCAVKAAMVNGEIAQTRYMTYLTIYDELQQQNRWDYKS